MSAFSISPFHLKVENNGEHEELWWVEVEDLARALCGALFLALPLHFTLEMWERARAIPTTALLIILPVCYFINVGFGFYSGYKGKVSRQNPWLDAFTCMGVGFLASLITMLLIDQLTPQMSWDVILRCVSLELVPTSFGAMLAKSQLGVGNDDDEQDFTKKWSRDKRKLLASLLGAIMFSFNVGATQEPILIATSAKSLQMIGIILFSLFVSFLMVFMTGFEEREDNPGGIMGPKWAETAICYTISLLVSATLLWMFGYLSSSTPPAMALPWIVVLGYATSLGGSAGRLVI